MNLFDYFIIALLITMCGRKGLDYTDRDFIQETCAQAVHEVARK